MTPVTFRDALQALDLTVQGFAALVRHDRSTCLRWGVARSGRGVQAFPAWVLLLLDAWLKHPELLDEAERDWHAKLHARQS